MKKIFALFLLLSSFSLLAVQDTIYFNLDWRTTSKEKASYYRVLKELERGDYWEYRDYYLKNDSLQNIGFFSELNPNVHDSICIWYHDNGQKSQVGYYENDSAIGVWTEYHDNGKLKSQGSRQKYLIGALTRWYKSGNLQSTSAYDTNGLTGKKMWYFDAEDSIRRIEFYTDNLLDSSQTEFYKSGQKKFVKHYHKGILNGNHLFWYENGQQKYIRRYKSGIEEDSVARFWASDGEESTREAIFDPKENYSLLWKITGNGIAEPSYLFGTMHVREKKAFDFSDTMISIFNSCEAYTMEIHPDSLYKYNLKPSETGFVSKTPIGALNKGYNYGGGQYVNMRWVNSLNSVYHRVGNNPDPMPYFIDAYLFNLALKRGKKGMGLESIYDHVNAGNDLPYYRKNFDILSEFNPDKEMMDVYISGDVEKIGALSNFLSSKEFNYHILTKRNIKMADMIDSLAHCHATFNTCGCAHLPSDEGVIQLLRDKGYTVEKVKGKFNGNKFDEYTNNYAPSYSTVTDSKSNYQVSVLGNPITIDYKGEEAYSVMNMIDEIGYLFVPMDFMLDTLDLSKDNADEIVETVVGGDADDYVIKTEKHKKGAFSILFDVNRNGITLRNRILVHPKARKLALAQTAYWEKTGVKYAWATDFLNSLTLDRAENQQTISWSTLTDSVAFCSVELPDNYKKIAYKKGRLYSAKAINNEYLLYVYEDYSYAKDSVVLLDFLDDAEETYGTAKKKKMSHFEGYSQFSWRHDLSTGAKVYYQVTKRGTKVYVQSSVEVNKKGEANTFINSLKLNEFIQMPLERYTASVDSFSVDVPNSKAVVAKYITGGNLFKDDTKEVKVIGQASYYNNWYETAEEVGDGEYFTDTEYAKYKREPRLYSFYDTLSGIAFSIKTHRYRPLYFFDTGLEDRYDRYATDSYWYGWNDTIYKTVIEDSNTYHVKGYVDRENRNTGIRYDMIVKGNHLYELKAVYPKEIDTTVLDKIFNSFDITRVPDTVDLVSEKFDLILDQLQSKDTLVQEEATGALTYTYFPAKYNRKIERLILEETVNDTNEIFNNRYDLIHQLSVHPDDTTEQFLADYYEKYCDSLEEKVIVLKVFSGITTASSVNYIFSNLPDSMATNGDYNAEVLLDVVADSVELVNVCFGTISTQLNHKTLGNDVLDEIKYAVSVDTLSKDSIYNYRKSIDTFFVNTADKFMTLTEDSSAYYKTKLQLTKLIEIEQYLDPKDDIVAKLKQLVKSDVKISLKTASALALLNLKVALSKEYWDDLYVKTENKYEILSSLIDNDGLNLLSDQYQEQEEFAKQQLNYLDQHNRYSYTSFEKINLYKRYKKEIDGVVQYFYAFTYYKGSNRERYVGISAGQPIDEQKVNTSAEEVVGVKKYKSDDKLKELVSEIFEDFLSKDKAQRTESVYAVEETVEEIGE